MAADGFFNTAKFPTITFKSNKLIFEGDKVVGAEGDFTLLGVTKPVKLTVSNFKCGENPFNKKAMCGAEISDHDQAQRFRHDQGTAGGQATRSRSLRRLKHTSNKLATPLPAAFRHAAHGSIFLLAWARDAILQYCICHKTPIAPGLEFPFHFEGTCHVPSRTPLTRAGRHGGA